MIPYVPYTWKDKLAELAILSILGAIVAIFGGFVALLIVIGLAAAYLYREHLKADRERAVRQRETLISDLQLQVEIARKAFAIAASGPDGLEAVEDLLEEYGVRRLEDLRPADHQDFLRELDDDMEELKERRKEKLDELLLRARHAGQSDAT